METLQPTPLNRYKSPYGDYAAPAGETYDYWKDELRALGQTDNFPAFSVVLDKAAHTRGRYHFTQPVVYRTLVKAATHIRDLRRRGLSTPNLQAFAQILAPALRDAYLRETLHLLCRRAGLSEIESRNRVARGLAEGAIALPDAYQEMAGAIFDEAGALPSNLCT